MGVCFMKSRWLPDNWDDLPIGLAQLLSDRLQMQCRTAWHKAETIALAGGLSYYTQSCRSWRVEGQVLNARSVPVAKIYWDYCLSCRLHTLRMSFTSREATTRECAPSQNQTRALAATRRASETSSSAQGLEGFWLGFGVWVLGFEGFGVEEFAVWSLGFSSHFGFGLGLDAWVFILSDFRRSCRPA